MSITYLVSDPADGGFDKRSGGPVAGASTYLTQKVVQYSGPIRCVCDLRVELQAVYLPVYIFHGAQSALRFGNHAESRRSGCDVVAVAHPDRKLLRQT